MKPAINFDQLVKAMPAASPAKIGLYAGPLNRAMAEFGIDAASCIVEQFLATVAHESGDLAYVEENLNYSAAALCKSWPSRFPTLQSAMTYARDPQKIANKVYANRMGNGDEASGDGWRYRGAGLIQLTGKANQLACAAHFGIAAQKIGDWLRTPDGACRSAAWFWDTHGLSSFALRDDFDGVCDVVNVGKKTEAIGDSIGYANRLAQLTLIRKAIV